MAKKKKKSELRTSVRLPDDARDAVARIEEFTGWTQTAALTFVFRAGVEGLYRGGEGLDGMRQLLEAQTRHHSVVQSAETLKAESARNLRAARKELFESGPVPAAMPIPSLPIREPGTMAAGGGPAAKKAKRVRGRPPKDHGPKDAPGQTTMAHAPRHPAPGLEC